MIRKLKAEVNKYRKARAFHKAFQAFRKSEQETVKRFSLDEADFFPCMDDNTAGTAFDRHYVYHVAWALRVVKAINPAFHSDISSSLYFCTALSAILPVKFYDYRPAKLELDQLSAEACDLTKLAFADNSIASLSCLHTIEHIGLGRYGDPIDYDGDLKAIAELKRVVKPGGSLLFVTPVGKAKVIYNAHRIYSFKQIMEYFAGFQLKEFSLVPDQEKDGGLIRHATEELANKQNYGCGCFWFVKQGG